jgi:hypothetical protein
MSTENVELEEQLSLFEDDSSSQNTKGNEDEFSDELKNAIMNRMQKIYNDGMTVGLQTACHTMLDKIYAFERKPGSKSTNDYKRLMKDVKKFCEIGVSRKMNDSGEAEGTETETTQN